MDNKKLLNYLLFFLSLSLILQVFFTEQKTDLATSENKPAIQFETAKEKYALGKTVSLKITNNTQDTLVFESQCPDHLFEVQKVGEDTSRKVEATISCENNPDVSIQTLKIPSGRTKTYPYNFWSHSLFDQTGQYQITANLKVKGEIVPVESNIFQIKERNFLSKLWLNGFYQPIYNFLILLLVYLPGHNLGLAIIILTLILRLILFAPSQKALHSQKKMAEIQPKLNEVKEKYKDNQQMIATETMKIWKENNVSPASSCLPMLIQFPILIALFYVVQGILNPDKHYLVYQFLNNFDFTQIQTQFLGFNLQLRSLYLLPVIVGGLQYFQLRQMQSNTPDNSKPKKEEKKKNEGPDPQAMQNMMQYFMPVMIAVFTSSMPAAIGIYWGSSTIFSIIQQSFIKPDSSTPDKPSSPKKRKKIDPKKITTIKI